jgi:hypothetical protein
MEVAMDNKTSLKMCTNCILPESYPGIKFDDAGVCNYCLNHTKWSYKGKPALDEFLEPFCNRGVKYDCVVGVSGGRDSSYMLYYLIKEYDLSIIAYTADHGFIPEIAKRNMKTMTDSLGVELVTEEHDYLRKCVTNNVSAWLEKPSPAMVPMICSGCKFGGPRGLLEFAKKNRIPLVAVGIDTPVERANLKQAFFATNPVGRNFGNNRTLSMLSGLTYEFARNPSYFSQSSIAVYVKEYFYFFTLEALQKRLYPEQTILNLYQYIEWNEDTILTTLKNELGWQLDPRSASTWRFDCRLSYLKNYLYRESLGFTEKDDGYSTMIRENMITRDEALERIKVENIIPEDILIELLEDIGLSGGELATLSSQQ